MMRAEKWISRGLVMLLILLMAVPCVASGEASIRTCNLTQLFGIQSAHRVLFLDADRICVINIEKADQGNQFTVIFVDIAREHILGEAQFVRPGYSNGAQIRGEAVCLTFEQYIAETDAGQLEEVIITSDGELTSRILPPEEQGAFPVLDGGWIAEQDANLYLREPGGDSLRLLLAGVPFDSEIENIFDTLAYRFFQALDDHRFVYERLSWEWSEGCGVYDLQTGEDRLLDKSGSPCLIRDGKLYTTSSVVDLTTYENRELPKAIRKIMNGMDVVWKLSPDGQTLCVLAQPYDGGSSLEFFNTMNGKRLEAIPLEAGYWELFGYLEDGVAGIYGYDRERQETLVHVCSMVSENKGIG